MKLIEKIVDKFLSDEGYYYPILILTAVIVLLSCMTIESLYNKKCRTDVALAKIAAGQVVDDKEK
jgi:hypothetical protein